MEKKIRITYYQRRPSYRYFGIERVFGDIRDGVSKDIDCRVAISRFESRGLFRRLYNCIEAAFRQGDINHITGDVHYLSYLLQKRKTILTIHDCGYRDRLHGLRRKIFCFLWYWLPEKRCSIISVISESTKKELLGVLRCTPSKVRIVENCVSKDFQAFPREFNTQKPNILQIGTSFNKNLIRVAQALQGVSCSFSIVGQLSKDQKEALERCGIEYCARSNISGKELVEIYRQCDMLVFASTYEGFGLPILEAQAMGRPVITSNVASMPEAAGDAACFVDPFDVESIRRGIMLVIRDSHYRENMINLGYKNVTRFQREMAVGKYLGLYKELLGRRGEGI